MVEVDAWAAVPSEEQVDTVTEHEIQLVRGLLQQRVRAVDTERAYALIDLLLRAVRIMDFCHGAVFVNRFLHGRFGR